MKVLIAYYSRTGNTEKVAKLIGEELSSRGIQIEYQKICPLKVKGYIKSAAGALLRSEVPLLNTDFDVSKYNCIIIGTPVWSASVASPVNSYMEDIKGMEKKKVTSFVTMAMLGGSMASGWISRRVNARGGKYLTGIKLSKQDLSDGEILSARVAELAEKILKK